MRLLPRSALLTGHLHCVITLTRGARTRRWLS